MALTQEQQRLMRDRFEQGASPEAVALEFGITVGTAYKYKQGTLGKKIQKDWKKVLEERSHKTESGCWLFGKPNACGTSNTISYKGKPVGANRVSYMEFIGPIPDKARITSECGDVCCINPEHLRILGEVRTQSTLDETKIRQIRAEYSSGSSLSQLAQKYEVSSSTISRIVNRKIWQHVE
jgi:transposase-like protein